MNLIVLFILSIFIFLSPPNGLAQSIPKAGEPAKGTSKIVRLDFTTQRGQMIEIRNNPAKSGEYVEYVFRQFDITSGRPGMDTPASPREGWVAGPKYLKRWSTKYQCWMPYAVNIGAVNAKGEDDGDYTHSRRMPASKYAASHGCVGLHEEDAIAYYNWVEPGRTRIFTSGSSSEYLRERFDGRKLLAFNTDGSIKGFLLNADGSVTDEFIKYVHAGKMEVHRRDQNGKQVSEEDGVLIFEFFQDPWKQGIPVAKFRKYEDLQLRKLLGVNR